MKKTKTIYVRDLKLWQAFTAYCTDNGHSVSACIEGLIRIHMENRRPVPDKD
jgi:hypothetical protein